MGNFSKLQIKSARRGTSQPQLNSVHLTTMDFGQIIPIYKLSLLPSDVIDVDFDIFARLSPLQFPSYGRVSIKTAAFFCPYYQLGDDIENWLSGQRQYRGQSLSGPRFIARQVLPKLFVGDSGDNPPYNGTKLATKSTSADYDICVSSPVTAGSPYSYFKFTPLGRRVYKVLRCLGYDIFHGQNVAPNSESSYNFLPLLSYLKCFNDWMSSSPKFNFSSLTAFIEDVRLNLTSLHLTSTSQLLGSDSFIDSLRESLSSMVLLYPSSYLTSAWRYPNSPLLQGTNTISIPDSVSGTGSIPSVTSSQYNSSTPLAGSPSSYVGLTSSAQKYLMAFDRYIRRNNYVGTREANRIYAKFGIKPSEFKSSFVDYLGQHTIPVQIGDVTQTSESTENSPLGSYAGKGIVNGGNHYRYESSDYGEFIVLAWLEVDPLYYQGMDKEVLRSDIYDWYNPEFDGLTTSPITYAEVCTARLEDPDTVVSPDTVFGFTERYNEYRKGQDRITGDYDLYPELKSWHFGRDMRFVVQENLKAQDNRVIGYEFDTNGNNQFDRVFAVQASENAPMPDHFFIDSFWRVSAKRPIMSMSEAVDLGNGDMSIDRNGTQLS
ncbi:major capsid protein [Sigmofec virus UA08Rod_4043]|uniref:Major capsid protein n=1 Tax=Sigmofec virus UA08Rod_4043 TaxID=2929393 RepID=A0A976R836_9VIRU|nr:major capsid protein [Sigmofec virus UA08Rod_4043]